MNAWRAACLACLLALLPAAADARPEFYVFDNGVGRGSWTPEQQASVLKELGYDGISYNYTNPEDLARWQKAFGAVDLKIYGLYVYTYIDRPEPFDPRLAEAIRMLAGTDTVVWITIRETKTTGDNDARAVANVRKVADIARKYGVKVALYGHAGFYVEHGVDSARIVAKAKRANVGATINLCHEYMSGVGDRLDATLKAVAPVSTRVSINGIDSPSRTWVARLDQGDFDMVDYLQRLRAAGYSDRSACRPTTCPAIRTRTWPPTSPRGVASRRSSTSARRTPLRRTSSPNRSAPTVGNSCSMARPRMDGRGSRRPASPPPDGPSSMARSKGSDARAATSSPRARSATSSSSGTGGLSFQGNSGVKYFVDEARGNGGGAIGHEYQTIDDENYTAIALTDRQKTGAWYDVIPPTTVAARPTGDWNTSRLVVRGTSVEHWLNGARVLAYDITSPAAAHGIATSKFRDVKGYADKIRTPLLLQDHDTVVWFRNLKVRDIR